MSIRVLGDLELSGVLRWKKNLSDFPANPQPYTLITKDGTPYFYTELVNGSGFFSWQPIGIKQASYLHVQGVASSLWTVTHNFNTEDFAYFVYDSNHNLMIADIQVIDLNTIKVDLSEAMTGTVVLFSLQYLNSTTISATQQLNLGSAVLTSNAGVLEVNNNPVAFTQYVDTKDAALGARIDNLISNTDPATIDSLSEIVTAFHNADGDLNAAITSMSTNAASALADESSRAQVAENSLQSALNIITAAVAIKADTTYVDAQLATKADSSNVDAQISALESQIFANVQVYNASLSNSIPTAVSQLTNDVNYQTASNVSASIAAEISGKANTASLSAVAMSGSYSDLANKPIIPVIPANVSAFNNDSNYQTGTSVDSKIQAVIGAAPSALATLAAIDAELSKDENAAVALTTIVSAKADKSYVDSGLAAKANSSSLSTVATSGSYSDLANKPAIPTVPANVSVFSNDAGYQTSAQVTTAIASASASSAGSALNNFAVKTLAVSGDIMPAVSGVSSIGSPTDKFHAIYTQELHIDANTLYVDGVPVIGSSANTIQISADLNQGMRIATTGTGQLILDSQTATTVQTNGTNADVVFQAIGTGSLARITSSTQVVLTAPIVNIQGNESISGDLTVVGNMTVNGTTTAVNTTNMTIKDNIVTVNKGELGIGVSLRYAGFEVDRGDLARERLIWDETVGKWVAGQTSQEVALATEPFVTAAILASTSSVTVSSLGLGNVSNTADTNKPVSTAQAAAIALKANVTDLTAETSARIAADLLLAPQATTYSKTQVDAAIAGATPSFSTLTGKPSTLSGFGITDAMSASAIASAIAVEATRATAAEALKAPQATTYTKTETDTRIQAVIGAAPIALATLAAIDAQLASDESAAAALVNAVSLKASSTDLSALQTLLQAVITTEVNRALAAEATKANVASLSVVATSGSFTDLTNKPSNSGATWASFQ